MNVPRLLPAAARRLALSSLGLLWAALVWSPIACRAETTAGSGATAITTVPYTITQAGTYYLNGDFFLNTNVNGITVNASDVVIDLNGHTISTAAVGAGVSNSGIYAYDRCNITVRNGTISGFLYGVNVDSSNSTGSSSYGHLVENLRVDRCTYRGISLVGGASVVRRCQIVKTGGSSLYNQWGGYGYAFGIFLAGAPGSRILDNDIAEVSRQPWAWSFGVLIPGGVQDVLAVGNRITGAQFSITYGDGSTGKYRDTLTGASVAAWPQTGTDAGGNN